MPLTRQAFEFLVENRMRDSRSWFNENKKTYETLVKQPLLALVESMAQEVYHIDNQLIVTPSRCISRVHRDTRFTKDKSLFRDVMWITFCRSKHENICPPALVAEFAPDGMRYGCGWWKAPVKVMESARELIISGDRSFAAAQKAFKAQDIFAMEGECFKRPRYADYPPAKAQWLERRELAFLRYEPGLEIMSSPHLKDMLVEGFEALAPIYRFLCKAQERVIR